jgi:hypothetical protein
MVIALEAFFEWLAGPRPAGEDLIDRVYGIDNIIGRLPWT